MPSESIRKVREHMELSLNYLKGEFAKIRGSRVQTALIEDIDVSSYGKTYKLKELASLSVFLPATINIQPWDKTIVDDIQKAIAASSLGLSSAVDGDTIRVFIPPLSEERRKEFVRLVREKKEEARISIRRARDETWDEIQTKERKKEISEDEKFRAKDELQNFVDEYNKKIDEASETKEKELMTV